jgi:hypothetical protein
LDWQESQRPKKTESSAQGEQGIEELFDLSMAIKASGEHMLMSIIFVLMASCPVHLAHSGSSAALISSPSLSSRPFMLQHGTDSYIMQT